MVVSPAGPAINTVAGAAVVIGSGQKLTDTAVLSGGYSHKMIRQQHKIVMILHGRYARNHWLYKTRTFPTSSITPRARIEVAPAITILSKIAAV